MKKFNIPSFYRSPIITNIKRNRRELDLRKKDLSPSVLKVGQVTFKIARHFGFCFGVENAIETAFRAIAENPGKRIFLLSEMIHNPTVNQDLKDRGVEFLMSTDGKVLIPFEELKIEDVVIVPAFGTTVELFKKLESIGINPQTYNATCPFVEKVWNRSAQLGEQGYTIIIHGKDYHEETRATFSHAKQSSASIIIRDMNEASELAKFIKNEPLSDKEKQEFYQIFKSKLSDGFNPSIHLKRVGVVNQTTMLAGETSQITEFFRLHMISVFGEEKSSYHIADTKDTLCYATSENQEAIMHLVESGGDIAVVVGGYNSSNTRHLAKLCMQKVPTYYIKDAKEIISFDEIRHMDLDSMNIQNTYKWLNKSSDIPITILISAGASSPDALVDAVIERLCELFEISSELKSVASGLHFA